MSGGTVGNAVFFRELMEKLYEEAGKARNQAENQPAMAADGCAQSGVEGGKPDAGDLRHKGGGVY